MICNESKRTIYASGGFELLLIVLEPDTGQCASMDVGTPRRVDYEIRVWKPLPELDTGWGLTNDIKAKHRVVCQRERWPLKEWIVK